MVGVEQLQAFVFNKGFLPVSHGHQIYFEQYGNPEGIPILFFHGGPGLGCTDFDKRFFHPQKHHVLFFDQRGAGKSLPSRSIDNNTTQHLIEDTRRLLNHCGFSDFHVFAGSWGSTLAMLYAIENPHHVRSMILRGYFPGTRIAKQFLEQGGTGLFFPEAWSRLEHLVPEHKKDNISAYYLEQLVEGDEKTKAQFAHELVSFNVATAKIGIGNDELNMIINTGDMLGKAIIQCHYSANDFFLPQDYILDNVSKVKDIPISLVHGRYDMICPPCYAYDLHKHLENSTIDIVTGGHLSAEPEIEKLLRLKVDTLSQ